MTLHPPTERRREQMRLIGMDIPNGKGEFHMLKRILAGAAACALLSASVSWAEVVAPAAPAASAAPVVTVQTTPEPSQEREIPVLSTDIRDYKVPRADGEFGIQAGEAVDDSFFDDAVFIGDSISLKLQRYVQYMRKSDPSFMGKAKFLVAGSLGSGNALWKVSDESVHPSYQGTKMRLEDSVALTGAKKVYIMLGINDVTLHGVEGSVENMKTLIGLILKKSPEVEIYVQSATPRIAAMKNNPTNMALFEYDLRLYEMCVEQGWNFVDVASVMRDGKGNLPDAYCSDAPTMGMHFTNEACQVWVDYLRTHTGYVPQTALEDVTEDATVESDEEAVEEPNVEMVGAETEESETVVEGTEE